MASYHYSLKGAFLKITYSDSQQEHVDEDRIPDDHTLPDGRKRQCRQQFNDSSTSKEWRQKIGNELAIKFLLKPGNIDYILANFPKGYMLYADEIGDNHMTDRSDVYLYSDHHKFRSPAEFVPHAAWLIAGMPPKRCKCKYCSPDKGKFSQKKLNNELAAGYVNAMENEAKRRYQVQRNKDHYTPRDQPLEEVFLKPVPLPE